MSEWQSEWQRVTRGCPQGSAFGSLIWNIFQNDLTYTVDANMNMYADDHQFYVVRSTLSDVHDDLAVCAESASSWYRANLLKGNLDKYQTMALGCGRKSMDSIMIDNHEVRSTECLKLLGVCIDNNLRFDEHISSISKKSAQRVGVLKQTKTTTTLFLLISKYTKHKLTIIRCQSQRLIWRRSESYNVLLSYNENKN